MARGALQLASPEVKFDLADDDTHDPIDVGVYQVRARGPGGVRDLVQWLCLAWRSERAGCRAQGERRPASSAHHCAGSVAAPPACLRRQMTLSTLHAPRAALHAAPQLRETNSMVEEFMLLANVAVAEAIVGRFPTCRCAGGLN